MAKYLSKPKYLKIPWLIMIEIAFLGYPSCLDKPISFCWRSISSKIPGMRSLISSYLKIPISGWWFGTFFFAYIGNVIIPTDELIFFRGVGSTTNQIWYGYWGYWAPKIYGCHDGWNRPSDAIPAIHAVEIPASQCQDVCPKGTVSHATRGAGI